MFIKTRVDLYRPIVYSNLPLLKIMPSTLVNKKTEKNLNCFHTCILNFKSMSLKEKLPNTRQLDRISLLPFKLITSGQLSVTVRAIVCSD